MPLNHQSMPIDSETLNNLDHRRLQALAKEYGVKANQKKVEIIRQISNLSEKSTHWSLSSQLRLFLVRVPGFSSYLDLYPIGELKRGKLKAAEAQQVWATLKLGTPLCFLFNLLPDQPDIAGIDINPETIDVENEEQHRIATDRFLDALNGLASSGSRFAGGFDASDLYHDEDGLEPNRVIKVLKVMIKFVEILPCPGHNRHIHDLPAELLSRIFDLLATPEIGERPIQPCDIFLVCRRWYNLALRLDSLWTNIYLGEPLTGKWGRPTKHALRVALSIRRSEGKDLSVVFKPPKPERKVDIGHYLAGGMDRITRFTAFMQPHSSHSYVLSQIQEVSVMPRLHTLALIQPVITERLTFYAISNRSLQVLQTRDMHIAWSTCRFPNLRALELSDTRAWTFRHFHDLEEGLRGMPRLESLIVHLKSQSKQLADDGVPMSRIHRGNLPALVTLELSAINTHPLHCFLHFIGASHLRQLRLTGSPEYDGPADWEQCKLTCLELESLTIQCIPSSTWLYQKLSPPPTSQVDMFICHDPDGALAALEGITSTNSIMCKCMNGKWGCGHVGCEALTEAAGERQHAVRWQTIPTAY